MKSLISVLDFFLCEYQQGRNQQSNLSTDEEETKGNELKQTEEKLNFNARSVLRIYLIVKIRTTCQLIASIKWTESYGLRTVSN